MQSVSGGRWAWVFLAGTLSACAGLPSGTGNDDPVDAGFILQVDPTLTDIQRKIFSPGCSSASCHGGISPQAGLDLRDAQKSFDSLVNQVARRGSCTPDAGPPVLIVVPGDPDNSQLMHKLDKTAAQLMAACQGGVMPRSNAQLPQSARDAIRQWIADGALNN